MKKIFISVFSLVVVVGLVCGNVFLKDQHLKNEKVNQDLVETKTDENDSEVSEEQDVSVDESNAKESNKTEESISTKKQETNTNSASKSSETKKNESKQETTNNQNKNDNSSVPSVNESKSESSVEDSNKQQNNVSTTFYDSITHGKREFSSESSAFARGTEIQSNELNYVLDYNEQHPNSQIQPDINYFRVYPSAIDENGNYWYYLHFFCQSGEGNDDKLKSKY